MFSNVISQAQTPTQMLNALRKESLENRMRELHNQYYGPSQEANIANVLSETNKREKELPLSLIKMQNENKLQLPKGYADIAHTNALTSSIPTEIQERIANTNRINTENQFIPQKYETENRNALTRQGELSNASSNSFKNWISTPEGQQIVKNRPDIANAILANIERQASQFSGEDVNQRPLPDNSSREDLIKDIQKGAADSYEKTNLPADTKKRLYAGNRFKSSVPSVMDNFKLASVYFSPSGRAKLINDERKAATNKRVPPELQAYRKFKQGLEQLKVQGAFLEGVPADQESRKAYGKVYDIDQFFNNPTDAYDSLNYAIQLANMADEANKSSLSDIKDNKKSGNNFDVSSMSDDELRKIAGG